MSRKRRNTSSPEADSPPAPKRHNPAAVTAHNATASEYDSSDDEESKEKPQFNEYTGQAGAFPGLGKDSDELFYGPASDGLEYLRMVRSEAKGVPQILSVVPATTTQNIASNGRQHGTSNHNHIEDGGGYYHDGTYTALTRASDKRTDDDSPASHALPPAQEHYHAALLSQFHVLQKTLRCTPPLETISSLPASSLISLPEDSRKARTRWEALVCTHDPHPAQLAVMDAASVLELVKLLRTKLIHLLHGGDVRRVRRVGAWLWSVLGKCRDRGELASEEVGELRLLAQRAVYLLIRDGGVEGDVALLDADADADDVDGGSQDGVTKSEKMVEVEVEEEGELLFDDDGSAGVDVGSTADRDQLVAVTLDMVITVVGEVYGQRDLLESRRKWQEKKIPI
ncbi:hypothetical protein LTR84_006311 [Exophiala bonariae]|uniref:Small-subunit processome Utp12 domain-containing protein n=1 Tax=Exophiala bonariae TaxID=1690606 RepID=A0AAV9N234_9EURO|nr:hypothetical protein LTR84_006311 [Exophiala bonariae]